MVQLCADLVVVWLLTDFLLSFNFLLYSGKSALLRQTCLLVILAQLGMRVPAASYKATLVDRIFTRIGASDRIMQGQSTFTLELAETSRILSEATNRSLVILDELGRSVDLQPR